MGARKIKAAKTTEATSATGFVPIVPEPSDAIRIPGEGLGLVIGKRELAQAVRKFASVVDRKSTMPMLANVSIRASADGSGITITGTDLHVTLRMTVPCKVARPGAINVNAKRLGEMVKSLPDGDVTIYQTTRTNAYLESGAAKLALDGLHDRDFPSYPSLSSKEKAHDFSEYDGRPWPTMAGSVLSTLIERVEHAICRDETRFHLNGILFESTGTLARMVATDGHRLAKAEAPIEASKTGGTPITTGAIIPRKGCVELGKLVSATYPCEVLITKTHAWFRQGALVLTVKLTDAQFPPYEQVIPKENRRLVTVDRDALFAALTRAKVNCCETRGVSLSLATGKLTVQADNPDDGGATVTECLAVDYQGDECCTGVSPKYLLDALDQIDGSVVIALSSAKGSAKDGLLDPMLVRSLDDAAMRPISGASFLSVVMPMRI
jgi:DNA polymerase-3 subunit beta